MTQKDEVLKIVSLLLVVAVTGFAVPPGFEDTHVFSGEWDYYALVYDGMNPGFLSAFEATIIDIAPQGDMWGITVMSLDWDKCKEEWTKGHVGVLSTERPRDLRDGDNVTVYAVYVGVSAMGNMPIPIFEARKIERK